MIRLQFLSHGGFTLSGTGTETLTGTGATTIVCTHVMVQLQCESFRTVSYNPFVPGQGFGQRV